MPNPIAEATAYLDRLEADRRAAIAISEQKSEEAKLLAARLEGFRAAMEILAGAVPDDCKPQSREPGGRRQRRNIPELILRELSFSGEAMTTSQIAKAIDYMPERTEATLKRLEMNGELTRSESGRWAAVAPHAAGPNEYAAAESS